MRKIIDYDVIRTRGPAEMTTRIKALLADGWQPFGNITHDPRGLTVQAVVKYQPEMIRTVTNMD